MAIEIPDASTDAVLAIRKAIADRAARGAFVSSALRQADAGGLSTAMPHRVVHLPLDGIRRGLPLRTIAQPGSWRVLVHERRMIPDEHRVLREKHVAIAAGAAVEEGHEVFEFAGLSEGPLVEDTETAIRKAEQRKEVREGRFEALLAMAPAICVAALWLKDLNDENGKADFIVTMPPSLPELKLYQVMTSGEFLAVVRRLAEELPTV